MKRTPNPPTILFLIFWVLILSSLACSLPSFLPQKSDPADLEELEELENLEAALNADTEDNRPEILSYLGNPDAFDISIVEVEGVQIRLESWRYFQYGTRVDFVDGEAVWTIPIEPMPEGTIFAAWYNPLDFNIGMTAAEAVQVIAAVSPAGAAPELIDLAEGGEDLAGGAALVGDQILVGLEDDQVIYVETVALAPEENIR
jgi:hypothetical protein